MSKPSSKQPYRTPAVTHLGSVSALTAGGSDNNPEGMGSMAMDLALMA